MEDKTRQLQKFPIAVLHNPLYYTETLLWPPCVADMNIIFCSCGVYLLPLFPRLFSAVADRMSTILPHMMSP